MRETYTDDDGSITGVAGTFISSTEVCGLCGLQTPKADLNEFGRCSRPECHDEYGKGEPTREETAPSPSNPPRPGWAWGDDWKR